MNNVLTENQSAAAISLATEMLDPEITHIVCIDRYLSRDVDPLGALYGIHALYLNNQEQYDYSGSKYYCRTLGLYAGSLVLAAIEVAAAQEPDVESVDMGAEDSIEVYDHIGRRCIPVEWKKEWYDHSAQVWDGVMVFARPTA